MSRTEGVTLPRLPTLHARVTSPQSIQPHSARLKGSPRRRVLSEPHYTAYVGTPRQDVPHNVYHDAAMFDDVFDKEGKLLAARNTPKITSPLHALGYSSLHDSHCRKLFLNNKRLRAHLMNLGLITEDLKVVASTREQRQKIRAHELLERKEQLVQKLEDRESHRLDRIQRNFHLPRLYQDSTAKEEERKMRAESIRRIKEDKTRAAEQEKRLGEQRHREEQRERLKRVVEEARLQEQARRNTARAEQQISEMTAYERMYGRVGHKLAQWHRDADRIHNRMIIMEHKKWSKMRKQGWLSESYPPHPSSHHSSDSSMVNVEHVPGFPLVVPPVREKGQSKPSAKPPKPTGKPEESRRKVQLPPAKEKLIPAAAPVSPPPRTEPQPQQPPKEPAPVDEAAAVSPPGEETRPHTEPSETTVTIHALEPQREPYTAETRDDDAAVTTKAETVTPRLQMESHEQEPPREAVAVEHAVATHPPIEETAMSPPIVEQLDPEQSAQELTKLLIDAFARVDYTQTGFISTENFINVLNSRDLGLQLDESELLYIASQVDVYGNGWVPFIHVASVVPSMLLSIYQQRAEQAIQQYGGFMEEIWCLLYLPSGGECYFNKFSGVMRFERPEDFRPFLKDDVFEDSVVDFFETADTDRDGIIDYNDFYALLVSPMVSTRIYSNQMEELLQVCQAYAAGGRMGLEEFAPVARTLLLMIYQNAYPDVEEWIELESRKYGTFWFNKITGDTFVPLAQEEAQYSTSQPSSAVVAGGRLSEVREEGTRKRKKKKHHRRRAEASDQEETSKPPSSHGPPPLRKKTPRSRERDHGDTHGSRSGPEEKPIAENGSEDVSAVDRQPQKLPGTNESLNEHSSSKFETIPEVHDNGEVEHDKKESDKQLNTAAASQKEESHEHPEVEMSHIQSEILPTTATGNIAVETGNQKDASTAEKKETGPNHSEKDGIDVAIETEHSYNLPTREVLNESKSETTAPTSQQQGGQTMPLNATPQETQVSPET